MRTLMLLLSLSVIGTAASFTSPLPARLGSTAAVARGQALRMSGGAGEDKKLSVGFIGQGIMGVPMAKNLLTAGFEVTVWNRSPAACEPAVAAGATQGASPAALVAACDVVFAMLSDPPAAAAVGEQVAAAMLPGKRYVDCSTVDAACSSAIAASVRAKGGMFLEAPVTGSKKPAEDGALVFLCAGDKALYDAVVPCLEVMGKKHMFLGEVGAGANMKLVNNMVMGSMMASLSEGLALANAAGLSGEEVLEVLDASAFSNPMFRMKGPNMLKEEYPPAFPLRHAQKDMRLALLLADHEGLALPVAAASNEQFKAAKGLGQADQDFSAVHEVQKK